MLNLPRVDITRQFALIDMQSRPARLDIQQPAAELDIRTTPISVTNSTRYPKVYIDQTDAFAQTGNKTIPMLSAESATQGIQDAQQGAISAAAQGDRMGNLASNEKDVVANLVWEDLFHPKQLTVRATPEVGALKIQWDLGGRDVEWELGKTIIQATPRRPVVSYEPGVLSIYLKQRDELHIRVLNQTGLVDIRV